MPIRFERGDVIRVARIPKDITEYPDFVSNMFKYLGQNYVVRQSITTENGHIVILESCDTWSFSPKWLEPAESDIILPEHRYINEKMFEITAFVGCTPKVMREIHVEI